MREKTMRIVTLVIGAVLVLLALSAGISGGTSEQMERCPAQKGLRKLHRMRRLLRSLPDGHQDGLRGS